MQKMIAIGGGEIRRPGYKVETLSIDKEIIKLSGKKNPKLLFIPTASSDSEGYCQVVQKHFGKTLGCKVEHLLLLDKKLTKKTIKEKVLSADIIYVGGGNTLKMMMLWRKLGVDLHLKQAHLNGVVVSGLSAGAICWFRQGESDSRKFNNPEAPYTRVRGLGLIKMLLCPHYDAESERRADLKMMMKNTSGTAIALENCCAIEIIDDMYKIIASKKSANAYRVYWFKGKLREELIEKSSQYKPLKELISK